MEGKVLGKTRMWLLPPWLVMKCFFFNPIGLTLIMSLKYSVFGQWPREGTKSCRIGRNYACTFVRLFVHLSVSLFTLAGPQTLLGSP